MTRRYLDECGVPRDGYDEIFPDPDAVYQREVAIDGPLLSPQIACPHTVDNVRPVEEVAGKHVDQVFIGSCANAKY